MVASNAVSTGYQPMMVAIGKGDAALLDELEDAKLSRFAAHCPLKVMS